MNISKHKVSVTLNSDELWSIIKPEVKSILTDHIDDLISSAECEVIEVFQHHARLEANWEMQLRIFKELIAVSWFVSNPSVDEVLFQHHVGDSKYWVASRSRGITL